MSKELVESLLKGSTFIDQQNKDIHTILHILFWLLRPEEIHGMMAAQSRSSLVFSEGNYWWTVWNSGKRAFFFRLNFRIGERVIEVYMNESGNLSCPPAYDQVQKVMDQLPVLVGGFSKLFPQLANRWEPFVKAAAISNMK